MTKEDVAAAKAAFDAARDAARESEKAAREAYRAEEKALLEAAKGGTNEEKKAAIEAFHTLKDQNKAEFDELRDANRDTVEAAKAEFQHLVSLYGKQHSQ